MQATESSWSSTACTRRSTRRPGENVSTLDGKEKIGYLIGTLIPVEYQVVLPFRKSKQLHARKTDFSQRVIKIYSGGAETASGQHEYLCTLHSCEVCTGKLGELTRAPASISCVVQTARRHVEALRLKAEILNSPYR